MFPSYTVEKKDDGYRMSSLLNSQELKEIQERHRVLL